MVIKSYFMSIFLFSSFQLPPTITRPQERNEIIWLHFWGPLISLVFVSPLDFFFFWLCYQRACAYHHVHNVFCVDSEEFSEPRESTRTQDLH